MMKSLFDENEIRERDLYLPMLELAQDTTLDAAFRADVVRNFHGSRIEELRQPMLDLLASNDVPEVRTEALTTLFWHLDDATVREAQAGKLMQVGTQVIYQSDLDYHLKEKHAGRGDDRTRQKALEELADRARFAQAVTW